MESPPQCYISELPDELLSSILREATKISYEVEPQRLFSLNKPWSSERRRVQEYRENLLFKLKSVKLISKQWHNISFPFQLEWVSIIIKGDDDKRLTQLLSTLQNQFGFENSNNLNINRNSHSANWYTKRFDVVFRHKPSPQLINTLVDIIGLFPNIEIFTSNINMPYTRENTDLHIPLQALPKGVRILNCEGYLVGVREWDEFLNNHPNLIAINPPVIHDPDNLILTHSPKQLKHFLLYPTFTRSRWLSTCPTMKLLTIPEGLPWSNNSIISKALPYASTLTRIHFVCEHICNVNFIHEYERLLNQCGNLERLDISIRNWKRYQLDINSLFILPLSVQTLGIRIGSNKSVQQSDVLWFMEWLTRVSRQLETDGGEREGKGEGEGQSEAAVIELFDDFTLDPLLAESITILQHNPKLITSWTMYDGTRMDLAQLELEEVLELQEQARMRMRNQDGN